MRKTLDLPETLLTEAMQIYHISTKTEVIKFALTNLIQKEKVKGLNKFFGKVDLDINLDNVRDRK